jgi:DNA repair protein RecO (recombination protein O)
MDWTDSAIVLNARPHGENNAVLEVYARAHGRYLGLVRGGRSRKLRPALQTGNLLSVEWRARLSEHLGFFVVELEKPYASAVFDNRLALSALGSFTALMALMAERDPHPALFDLGKLFLDHLDDVAVWPQLLVRWELRLLAELGVGLDLTQCAATGAKENLVYVSPKSARAVSAEAGKPYRDRLLRLPDFLCSASVQKAEAGDIIDGFALTGHFLETNVFHQRNQPLPNSRQDFLRLLEKTLH